MDLKFTVAAGLPSGIQDVLGMLARKDAVSAEQALRKMLKAEPGSLMLTHLLGIAMVDAGQVDEGLEMIRKSLRMRPNDASLRCNYATVLRSSGRTEAAIAEFRRAIEMNPRQVDAYANLGKMLLDRKEYAEAQAVLQKGAQLAPNHLEMLNDWGVALLKQRRHEEAEGLFRRALTMDERCARAHNNLGMVLHRRGDIQAAERELRRCLALDPKDVKAYGNLGRVLRDAKKCEEALQMLRLGLEIAPNSHEIHRGLGNVLHELRRFDEALAELQIALDLRPDDEQILADLAGVYHGMDRLDEALAALRRAQEAGSDSPEVHSGIGYNCYLRGMIAESLASYEAAIQRDPADAELHIARAIGLLLSGDWERGWEAHEWRLKRRYNVDTPARTFGVPVWDGAPLNGRTILLHWEQGLGDSIQFCRYVPLVARMGGRVVLEVQESLVRLMQSLEGAEQVVAYGEPLPPFDLSCSLLSLPYLLKTRPESVPAQIPYLRPAGADVETWQGRLGPRKGFRVALAWRGQALHALNRRRSMALNALMPILDVPGAEFYSIQMGGAEEIAQAAPGRIADLTPHIKDFADTAAFLSQMDLLISVDTSVVHLAGALNIPVWMLLYVPTEWRWLLNRTDSPWYPSMRIFRQRQALEWAPVVEEVAAALGEMCPSRP